MIKIGEVGLLDAKVVDDKCKREGVKIIQFAVSLLIDCAGLGLEPKTFHSEVRS